VPLKHGNDLLGPGRRLERDNIASRQTRRVTRFALKKDTHVFPH
jgi:hypothetical protein